MKTGLYVVVGLVLCSNYAVAYTFTTIDCPGGLNTQLNGIDGGNIVGNDYTLPGGFLYNGSTYTGIADPLVPTGDVEAGTWPNGISGNNVVGSYLLGSGTNTYHGFLYNGSTYQTLDDPLANTNGLNSSWGTVPTGVSGGTVVGGYATVYAIGAAYYNVFHGFVYNGSTYTTIDDPLAGTGNFQGTWARGIQGNEVVGDYTDASNDTHGFIYNVLTRSFTALDDPLASGSSGGTYAQSISGDDIVGQYYNSSGAHGFIYDGSSYTTLDDPLGTNTYAVGISGETVVGWYTDSSGHTHGFEVTVPEPSEFAMLAAAAVIAGAVGWRRRARAA